MIHHCTLVCPCRHFRFVLEARNVLPCVLSLVLLLRYLNICTRAKMENHTSRVVDGSVVVRGRKSHSRHTARASSRHRHRFPSSFCHFVQCVCASPSFYPRAKKKEREREMAARLLNFLCSCTFLPCGGCSCDSTSGRSVRSAFFFSHSFFDQYPIIPLYCQFCSPGVTIFSAS